MSKKLHQVNLVDLLFRFGNTSLYPTEISPIDSGCPMYDTGFLQ